MTTRAPLWTRVGDQLAHALDRLLVDERADVDTLGLVPRPTAECPHPLAELSANSSATEVCTRKRLAAVQALTHVAHLGDHRALDRGVHVGVLEDEERRVAPSSMLSR